MMLLFMLVDDQRNSDPPSVSLYFVAWNPNSSEAFLVFTEADGRNRPEHESRRSGSRIELLCPLASAGQDNG